MNGLNYPDNLYADHEERKARRAQAPLGAYRSTDPVTKPAHYQRAGIETIDYIRATLDGPGFEAYCIGNVLKYVSRYREKGGVEDLRKAQVYLGWAIQPVDGKRQSQPEGCNPAAMREANIAYDVATDEREGRIAHFMSHGFGRGTAELMADAKPGEVIPVERFPKWDPAWGKQSHHPMQAEAIRDHDERLSGADDRL